MHYKRINIWHALLVYNYFTYIIEIKIDFITVFHSMFTSILDNIKRTATSCCIQSLFLMAVAQYEKADSNIHVAHGDK